LPEIRNGFGALEFCNECRFDMLAFMRCVIAGLAALALMAVAGCAADPVPGACKLAKISDLPVQRLRRHLLIDARINDKPARLVFDTGAFTSLITPGAASRLQLSFASFGGDVSGIGGRRIATIMSAHSVELGKLHGRNFLFMSADLGEFGEAFATDGLLSSDLLSKWDIDLDLHAEQVRLYLPVGDCRFPSAFLRGSLYQVPMLPTAEDHRPRITVTIGGQKFTALVDTGADTTSIYRHAAARLGLHIADLAADRHTLMRGVGPRAVRSVTHVFEPMAIGDLTVQHMPIDIIDEAADEPVDILLGADFQERVHLWISYSSGTLIMEYPPLPSPEPPPDATP